MLRRAVFASNYDVLDEGGQPLLWIQGTTRLRVLLAAGTVVLAAVALGATLAVELRRPELPTTVEIVTDVIGAALVWVLASTLLLGTQHFTVYRDRSGRERLLGIVQTRRRLQYGPVSYRVELPGARSLATIVPRTTGLTMDCFGPDGTPMCIARSAPYFSADSLLRTAFYIRRPVSERSLGAFTRTSRLLAVGSERYRLDLDAEGQPPLDRRVAVALAVLLARRSPA